MMWAYFTFLDAGSPHKTSDQQRILHRASLVSWTPMHSKDAGFLHDEMNRCIRLQCDYEPLSRGIFKISKLVKVAGLEMKNYLSRDQYKRHGIPTSESKAVSKADRFTAWGTEVDSKSGRVGTPMIKLKQLSQLIASVCKLPRVSKKLLQAVTGLLVHPFMHRRSLMCILQDTFLWIERLKDGDSKPLPTSVREELLCSGLMLPLCHSNAKWEVSCRIGASDASLSHGGRAATIVSQPIADTLYRYVEHKGEHIRLDWEKCQVQVDSDMRRAPPELEDLIATCPGTRRRHAALHTSST